MNTPALRPGGFLVPTFEGDALARLLLRYGIGPAEQAAIRAFGRIVDPAVLAAGLAERFGLLGEEEGGPPLVTFCAGLTRCVEWDFSSAWLQDLVGRWLECYLAGAVTEFPFLAIEALLADCRTQLLGERSTAHRLELDIQSALVRLGCCLGGVLADATVEQEQAFRICAEDGDPVLGIPNRRRFLGLLDEHLRRVGEESVLGLVVVTADWGCAADVLALDEQDHLRLALSDAMRAVLRPRDILCALGNAEWAVILPDLRGSAQVSLAAYKLVDACEAARSNAFPALRGRFCAGGSWAPEHARNVLELERTARMAVNVARRSGQLFDVYCPDVARQADGDAHFETEVARAFEARQFQLYLQPQVALPSRRPVGAEALLRWIDGDGKVVSPARILRVFERLGLMADLSRWVIQQAAQSLAALEAVGCGLRISANLVAEDLQDPELPLFIRQTCETWRISPSNLCFELTEGGLVSSEGMSVRTLEALKVAGGRVALDDFGTGYSSMDYLRRLPVDELKIDKSFVERIVESGSDRSIVELMVRIAHAFGLEVVAEGVETAETESMLSDMGCDCAQGYLYAPAMSVEAFIAWWRDGAVQDDSSSVG
ncbi:bifunctional diguanylate cyclase/phosphodiesterase [Zoogloea sp. LCSB751]|uniref:putative bifunctional diguanylate cyclase/phosphodiesterase n=1 Tax=Zoogloea sp. LCSB751 TaxID=1965277 RepID=UPI0009A49FF1|nr:bifunctional diguanylate cyclase/phosphodiesterase [Zoogloea sp. LCSB751]